MPGALDKLAGTASSLVSKFGKTASLARVTKTPNAATGKSTITTVTSTVVITPPVPPDVAGGRVRATGGVAEEGDLICSVAARDVARPAIGDRLTIDAEVFQIVSTAVVYAGEVAALYELHIRS